MKSIVYKLVIAGIFCSGLLFSAHFCWAQDSDSDSKKIWVVTPDDRIVLKEKRVSVMENHSESNANWTTTKLQGVTITGVAENSLIIDGESYQFNGKTLFRRTPLAKMIFPTKADVTYKTFYRDDEAHPYDKVQKIITEISTY